MHLLFFLQHLQSPVMESDKDTPLCLPILCITVCLVSIVRFLFYSEWAHWLFYTFTVHTQITMPFAAVVSLYLSRSHNEGFHYQCIEMGLCWDISTRCTMWTSGAHLFFWPIHAWGAALHRMEQGTLDKLYRREWLNNDIHLLIGRVKVQYDVIMN